MSSEAYDVIAAVATLIDSNKSVIQTVTTVYQSLDVLEREARETPSIFPKAIIVFGVTETPQTNRAIGKTMYYLLPVAVDIYVPEVSDIQLERENCIEEVRNILEADANTLITANQHRIVLPLSSVQRLVTYQSDNPDELILGLASVTFNVDYRYEKGTS